MSNIDMNKNSENGSSNYTGDDKFVIKNLNLHYGDFHALKNINMNIPKNQITAFIGPSGCGKSTFLKTLNRMNDLIEGVKIDGEVYLDGANIFTEMDDITLRHRVGMVFQQPNPFPKSIYDNIAYGPRLFGVHKKAELDIIVEKALKQAAIWDEVKDRLKKSALGLSGGQKQRISIARALLRKSPILILDDSTSALDMETEHQLLGNLNYINKNCTTFIIAHRISAVKNSDIILYLEDGEIKEKGTHDELIKKKGKYYDIYCEQFKDFYMVEKEVI